MRCSFFNLPHQSWYPGISVKEKNTSLLRHKRMRTLKTMKKGWRTQAPMKKVRLSAISVRMWQQWMERQVTCSVLVGSDENPNQIRDKEAGSALNLKCRDPKEAPYAIYRLVPLIRGDKNLSFKNVWVCIRWGNIRNSELQVFWILLRTCPLSQQPSLMK